jgi:hypothetical protein
LKRCAGLDVIIFLERENVHVVVEDMVLREGFFAIFNDVVADFDDVVIVIDVAAYEVV